MTPLYIAIATSGRPDTMLQVLDDLAKCTLPDFFAGTVIVENGPKSTLEGSISNSKHDSLKIEYQYESKPGKSHALNIALTKIQDKALIFFTDDDVRLHNRDILMTYSEAAEQGAGHYFGGPVSRNKASSAPPIWLRSYLPLSVLGWNPVTPPTSAFFLGYNWAAFKQDIERAGGFDSKFGPGASSGATGQESNMQEKLLNAGCISVFLPNACVQHTPPLESSRVFWALRRRYRAGIYSGLSDVSSPIEYDRSFAGSTEVYSLDPNPKLKGHYLLVHMLLRPIFKISRRLGRRRGQKLRSEIPG